MFKKILSYYPYFIPKSAGEKWFRSTYSNHVPEIQRLINEEYLRLERGSDDENKIAAIKNVIEGLIKVEGLSENERQVQQRKFETLLFLESTVILHGSSVAVEEASLLFCPEKSDYDIIFIPNASLLTALTKFSIYRAEDEDLWVEGRGNFSRVIKGIYGFYQSQVDISIILDNNDTRQEVLDKEYWMKNSVITFVKGERRVIMKDGIGKKGEVVDQIISKTDIDEFFNVTNKEGIAVDSLYMNMLKWQSEQGLDKIRKYLQKAADKIINKQKFSQNKETFKPLLESIEIRQAALLKIDYRRALILRYLKGKELDVANSEKCSVGEVFFRRMCDAIKNGSLVPQEIIERLINLGLISSVEVRNIGQQNQERQSYLGLEESPDASVADSDSSMFPNTASAESDLSSECSFSRKGCLAEFESTKKSDSYEFAGRLIDEILNEVEERREVKALVNEMVSVVVQSREDELKEFREIRKDNKKKAKIERQRNEKRIDIEKRLIKEANRDDEKIENQLKQEAGQIKQGKKDEDVEDTKPLMTAVKWPKMGTKEVKNKDRFIECENIEKVKQKSVLEKEDIYTHKERAIKDVETNVNQRFYDYFYPQIFLSFIMETLSKMSGLIHRGSQDPIFKYDVFYSNSLSHKKYKEQQCVVTKDRKEKAFEDPYLNKKVLNELNGIERALNVLSKDYPQKILLLLDRDEDWGKVNMNDEDFNRAVRKTFNTLIDKVHRAEIKVMDNDYNYLKQQWDKENKTQADQKRVIISIKALKKRLSNNQEFKLFLQKRSIVSFVYTPTFWALTKTLVGCLMLCAGKSNKIFSRREDKIWLIFPFLLTLYSLQQIKAIIEKDIMKNNFVYNLINKSGKGVDMKEVVDYISDKNLQKGLLKSLNDI